LIYTLFQKITATVWFDERSSGQFALRLPLILQLLSHN